MKLYPIKLCLDHTQNTNHSKVPSSSRVTDISFGAQNFETSKLIEIMVLTFLSWGDPVINSALVLGEHSGQVVLTSPFLYRQFTSSWKAETYASLFQILQPPLQSKFISKYFYEQVHELFCHSPQLCSGLIIYHTGKLCRTTEICPEETIFCHCQFQSETLYHCWVFCN